MGLDISEREAGPAKIWTPLSPKQFRIDWNGVAWILETTEPGSRYPWVLTNGQGDRQDIGVLRDDVRAAQARAEFWLVATAWCGAPPMPA